MRAKLFVGNLNYETSIENLEAVFRPFQGYLHTKICYARQTGKPLGYAVVHFDNQAAAQYAIDVLHNAEVDGRHIVVAPYRPRVSDGFAPNAAARPSGPSRPTANGAVALVMDLNKNATWMDLKDILSQRSKVLFVDEPRMLRAAFVHFASEEDREQAVAAFQNTQLLGGTVDVVPISKDSVLLGPDANTMEGGYPQQHRHPPESHGRGQHMGPQAVVPVTYMAPGMAPMPPHMGMDQQYSMQRPHMWQGGPMQSFVPQHVVPAMQPPGYQAPANTRPPLAGVAAGGAGPSMTTQAHPGGSGVEGSNVQQYPPGVSRGHPTGSSAPTAASGTSPPAPQHSTPAEAISNDSVANLPPDLQQLVRQLAMQQLSGHQDPQAPDDR